MDSFANLCEKILAEAVLVRRVEKLLGSDILSRPSLAKQAYPFLQKLKFTPVNMVRLFSYA